MDVQQEVLIFGFGAFAPGMIGEIVDYGVWPEQSRQYWTLATLTQNLSDICPGTRSASLLEALKQATKAISELEFFKQSGPRMHLSLGFIDAGRGQDRDTIFRFCRDHGGGIWYPSTGIGITASKKDLNEGVTPKPGEKYGPYWFRRPDASRGCDWYGYDSNYAKTKVHEFLAAPEGDEGSLRLFVGAKDRHILLSDHLYGEYPTKTEGRGRTVIEFKERPGMEQHYLDVLAGLIMAASARGISLPGTEGFYQSAKKRGIRRISQDKVNAQFGG